MAELHHYVYIGSDSFDIVRGFERQGVKWFELTTLCKIHDIPFMNTILDGVGRHRLTKVRHEGRSHVFISEEGIDELLFSTLEYCCCKREELRKRFEVG